MSKIRALVYQYEDASEDEWGPSGFTSDRAILEIAESVNDRAIGEWLLWKVGRVPEGLRLIRTFRVEGLDQYPGIRFYSPMVNAAMRWKQLDLPDRMGELHDYRTVGARVIRARTRTPVARIRALERNPDAAGVRSDGSLVYAPPRGEYCDYGPPA